MLSIYNIKYIYAGLIINNSRYIKQGSVKVMFHSKCIVDMFLGLCVFLEESVWALGGVEKW